MRSTRNQPFCWQEKAVTRYLRKRFSGMELTKYLVLYQTITELDSDFNGQDIKYYTKTIATYSGLSRIFIPKAIKMLESAHVLKIEDRRFKGKYGRKTIIFTPEEFSKYVQESVAGLPVIGQTTALEDSNLIEDNNNSFADAKGETEKIEPKAEPTHLAGAEGVSEANPEETPPQTATPPQTQEIEPGEEQPSETDNPPKKENDQQEDKDYTDEEASQKIVDLIKGEKKYLKVIGLFIRANKVRLKNGKHLSAIIGRYAKAAQKLDAYTTYKVIQTMDWLVKNADYKWTVETVEKYIDYSPEQLAKFAKPQKQTNNPRVFGEDVKID